MARACSADKGGSMRASFLWVLSAALALVACGSEEPPCEAPDGCLAVSRIAGSCQCLDWKVVSDEIVPLKFLVTGVLATPPGNQSGVSYGDASLIGPGNPPGKSQLGTRLRAVLRDASGKRTVLSAEVPSVAGQGQYMLTALGGTTLAVGMAPGNGIGLGNVLDIYPPTAHRVMVWVNPALRIVRDAGGHMRGMWGWSGTCFSPEGASGGSGTCSAPNVFMYSLDEIAGNVAGAPSRGRPRSWARSRSPSAPRSSRTTGSRGSRSSRRLPSWTRIRGSFASRR